MFFWDRYGAAAEHAEAMATRPDDDDETRESTYVHRTDGVLLDER